MNGVQDAPLGLLSFLSFGFSVIAAVSAIDMYKLLRTGEFGKTWRLLIIASVMLTLLQVLRMAEILNFRPVTEAHLAQIVELCFVMSLAYAFYVQRKLFHHEHKPRIENEEGGDDDSVVEDENPEEADDLEANDLDAEDLADDSNDASDDASKEELVSTPHKNWAQYENIDISRPTP